MVDTPNRKQGGKGAGARVSAPAPHGATVSFDPIAMKRGKSVGVRTKPMEKLPGMGNATEKKHITNDKRLGYKLRQRGDSVLENSAIRQFVSNQKRQNMPGAGD